jgi:hypothetical protein
LESWKLTIVFPDIASCLASNATVAANYISTVFELRSSHYTQKAEWLLPILRKMKEVLA